jgi:hypothetical protein
LRRRDTGREGKGEGRERGSGVGGVCVCVYILPTNMIDGRGLHYNALSLGLQCSTYDSIDCRETSPRQSRAIKKSSGTCPSPLVAPGAWLKARRGCPVRHTSSCKPPPSLREFQLQTGPSMPVLQSRFFDNDFCCPCRVLVFSVLVSSFAFCVV